jgi:hypothetical protein
VKPDGSEEQHRVEKYGKTTCHCKNLDKMFGICRKS